ncbi:hypothetical protein [Mucilaginibacter sp. UYCu711]|uniref:hypothetical protein n=1 Tax=Mucilaginibacter sp. UYCu711 TaxID=3156339 RepID=UPI003D1A23BA
MINNNQQQDQTNDRMAERIADPIIKGQRRLAAALNQWINRYSKKRQQWLLVIFCGIAICGLIICLAVPFGRIAMQRQSFQPSHIGLPSDGSPTTTHLKPTDPLTKKK